MGSKTCKAVIAALSVLMSCTPCYAETASDLYAFYGVDYAIDYPEDVLKTISDYNSAKRYVQMFRYVSESEYDHSIIDNRIEELELQLDKAQKTLMSGYNLSLSEIYAAEDMYKTVTQKLDDACASKECEEIEYQTPSLNSVPSYTEYVEALNTKALIKSREDIGNITGLKYPVSSAALVDSVSDNALTLSVLEGSTVTSLFDGVIAQVTDDSITVYHYNGIYTYYGGVITAYVEKGDTVSQGQSLGSCGPRLTLKLKLDRDLVNISELFKEV